MRPTPAHRFGVIAGLLLGLAVTLLVSNTAAFPGVCIGQDAKPRFVHETRITVMHHEPWSIVTVMADYEGPLTPFACVLPVPADVVASEVRTVRQGILRRVEQISAPRMFTFYEQDPCGPIPLEHRWDEAIEVRGQGFLTPPEVRGLDRRYNLSNLLSAPTDPTFKGAENEFRYRVLAPKDVGALEGLLVEQGYRPSVAALAALRPYVGGTSKLLFAEVSIGHVEITGTDRVRLGGIRFVTRQRWATIPIGLGLQNSPGSQELLVFVLDRAQRFGLRGHAHTVAPTNLRVAADSSLDVSALYNAVFDRVRARHGGAAVTEYAWSTAGCGEPCPDAPLALDELMTLGGDVLEARTTTSRERAGAPLEETRADKRTFAQQVAELPPMRRAQVERERTQALRELGRREALKERQTYVLSRVHHRYAKDAPESQLELAPAEPVRGGTGVPEGPAGELPVTGTVGPGTNRFQTRFVAFQFWSGELRCAAPIRFRWGKRWASEVRASRAVPLAMDLARAPRATQLLDRVLKTKLPELAAEQPRIDAQKGTPPPRRETGSGPGGCSLLPGSGVQGALAAAALSALGVALRRLRRLEAGASTKTSPGSEAHRAAGPNRSA